MRIAMIGCGNIAHTAYADSLIHQRALDASLVLAACCDISEEAAARYAKRVGFQKHYTDWEAMLDVEKPDAVIVTTPFSAAIHIAPVIMRRGIALLLEKPPGCSMAEYEAILAVSEATGCLHQVAFNRRHMPLAATLMETIRKNGETIRHIGYRMYRVNRRESHFHTTAIHGLDLVTFLCGGEVSHADFAYSAPDDQGITGAMEVQAAYANGCIAQMSFVPMSGMVLEQLCVTTHNHAYSIDLPVWNTDGYTGEFAEWQNSQAVQKNAGPELDPDYLFVQSNGFDAQLGAFFSAVRKGQQPRDSLRSCHDSMALMEAMAQRQAAYPYKS